MDDGHKSIQDRRNDADRKLDEQVDAGRQWSQMVKDARERKAAYPSWDLLNTIFDR